MSTRAFASIAIPAPINTVWNSIGEFTFPQKFISTISKVEVHFKVIKANVYIV